MSDQELYSGLIRLHVLHHATHEPIFGAGIIEELARHGYRLSPGTVYPLLHSMKEKGYLEVSEEGAGRKTRLVYRATAKGRKALQNAKGKVRELFSELLETELEKNSEPPSRRLEQLARQLRSEAEHSREDRLRGKLDAAVYVLEGLARTLEEVG